MRERFFTPRLRVKSYDELNAWLLDQCIAYAKAHPIPSCGTDDLAGVRGGAAKLVPYPGRFDGFHAVPASVSKTCLVRFDNNKYSVAPSAVGRPVEIHAYAERIVIRQDGALWWPSMRARFGRDQTIYDPWHYVPVLARKPGALRNGAPFKDWVLPAALERVRRKLAGSDDGDRQMVEILAAVLSDGLPAVEAACAEALAEGVHSADVILNILARQRDPGPTATILTPDALQAAARAGRRLRPLRQLIGRSQEDRSCPPSLTGYEEGMTWNEPKFST